VVSTSDQPAKALAAAERAISVELLAAIMSLSPDATVVVDGEGHVVAVNERAEELFGYAPGDLAGRPIEVLVPERARHRHRQHRSVYLTQPQNRPMGASLELTGRRRDGSEFPLDISLAPIVNEGERLVVAAVRDMTEQRRATAAQAELATIVRSSFDAIISTTLEGAITNWNPAAEALLGYSRDEALGQHIAMLVPEHASLVWEELLDRASSSGRRGALDTQWRRQDGHLLDVAVSVSPLPGAGGTVRGYSALARDITQRKAAENELRRLLAEEERLQRQHAATSEIRLALLSGTALPECLTLICQRASELLDSPVAAICVGEGGLRFVAAVGPAAALVGRTFPAGTSVAGLVLDRQETVEDGLRSYVPSTDIPDDLPDGPSLGVPITMGGAAAGSLLLARPADGAPFGPPMRVFAESLAAQASLALEFDRARADREAVALVGDRERIARDLHDHVIQRLFGAGMSLQGTLPLVAEPMAQRRLSDIIDQLDETIREIRSTIFGLATPAGSGGGVRAKIMGLAREAEVALGFAPTVRFEGAIDAAVPDDVVPHALACVREGLSNAARHAGASEVTVLVVVSGPQLTVSVTDNGRGIGPSVRSSGLANLKERARLLGGTFAVLSPPGGGAQLVWTVSIER
jgi:PAS domain S-box-containing protein